MNNSHDQSNNRTIVHVSGMTCTGCESILEKKIASLSGVIKITADHTTGTVTIDHQSDISIKEIIEVITVTGYEAVSSSDLLPDEPKVKQTTPWLRWVGLLIVMFMAYQLIQRMDRSVSLPALTSQVSYGILFLIGLLTSLHCVTMCGGIAMSQCLGAGEAASLSGRLRPSLLYNGGRVVSYTIIGGVIGAAGSVISMTIKSQGIIVIVAGTFMILMGLNLLGLFPFLRRLTPHLPKGLTETLSNKRQGKGPFVVGLINGFMPCGPLQTMQLYALGTGSFVAGATSMFFFSLGTVPLLFALGALSTLVSQKFNRKMLAASGVLVMVLGLVMISRGLSLTGTVAPSITPVNYSNVAVIENGRQIVKIQLEPYYYEPIVVQVGIPVTFIIEAEQSNINGCNNAIVIPAYNLQDNIIAGENIFEFTPTETGTVSYACWMGMIRSSIEVVEDVSVFAPATSTDGASIDEQLDDFTEILDDCCTVPETV